MLENKLDCKIIALITLTIIISLSLKKIVELNKSYELVKKDKTLTEKLKDFRIIEN